MRRFKKAIQLSVPPFSDEDICLKEDSPNLSDLDLLDSGSSLRRVEQLRQFGWSIRLQHMISVLGNG